MSQPNAKPSTAAASGAGHAERTAALNWFIPPFVIPALIILLVAARAIWLA